MLLWGKVRDGSREGDPKDVKGGPGAGCSELQLDQRKHTRVHSPLAVGGLRALLSDVSPGGIGLVMDTPVSCGDRFRLVLTDVTDGSSQDVEAEVAWCTGNRAGLRWVGVTAAQDQWLHDHFRRWRNSGGRWVDLTTGGT